jgi:hypothetical protein
LRALAFVLSVAADAESCHPAGDDVEAVAGGCGQVSAVCLPDAGHDEDEEGDSAEEENGGRGEDDVKGGHCSLLRVVVRGDGDGAVFNRAEPARSRVVAVRGVGHDSRADEGSDHVDFTPVFVVRGEGRENEEVG